MLVKWNQANSQKFLKVPEFHPFLLDVLLQYQAQMVDKELSGIPAAVKIFEAIYDVNLLLDLGTWLQNSYDDAQICCCE